MNEDSGDGSKESNYYRRDSSFSPERCEDDDYKGQGLAMTFTTLNSILEDNTRLIEFLRSIGVLSDKYVCAACRKPMSCVKLSKKRCRDGLMWRCRKHNVWRTIRKGAWFERSKIAMRDIVLMTYYFCLGKSVAFTSRKMGLTPTSVIDWFSTCRAVCAALVQMRGKIGGPGVVVEIGETSFGSHKFVNGKWVEELWVLGAVVCGKEHSELVLKVLEKRNASTLLCFIEEHVEDGTFICSDKWKAYEDISDVELKIFAAKHDYQLHNEVTGVMERHWEERTRSCLAIVESVMLAPHSQHHCMDKFVVFELQFLAVCQLQSPIKIGQQILIIALMESKAADCSVEYGGDTAGRGPEGGTENAAASRWDLRARPGDLARHRSASCLTTKRFLLLCSVAPSPFLVSVTYVGNSAVN